MFSSEKVNFKKEENKLQNDYDQWLETFSINNKPIHTRFSLINSKKRSKISSLQKINKQKNNFFFVNKVIEFSEWWNIEKSHSR